MADSNPRANTKTRVFTSFDFEHDEKLREFLVGQSRNPRSPFEIADWSLKEALPGDWKEKVRSRIRSVDVVLVICGEHTDRATGVSAEVRIAREEGKPVYFIEGRKNKDCKLPQAALPTDQMVDWTWPNIAAILGTSAEPPSTDFMAPDQVLLLLGGLGLVYVGWRAFTSKGTEHMRTQPAVPWA